MAFGFSEMPSNRSQVIDWGTTCYERWKYRIGISSPRLWQRLLWWCLLSTMLYSIL